jgi:hypothetical protein
VASYVFHHPTADVGRLRAELAAAGLPVDYVVGPDSDGNITVVTFTDLSGAQYDQMATLVAAHDGRPRQTRTFGAILADYNALPGATRSKVYADLTAPANNPKWQEDRTSDFAALEFLSAQSGANATSIDKAKSYLAVAYCQRYPTYLVNPPFAPEVNIPGDEPIA